MQYFYTLLILLMTLIAAAQVQREGVDIVVLKDGNEHVGKIMSYQEGEVMLFRKLDGEEITIPGEAIASVREQVWGVETALYEREQAMDAPEGWYNVTALSLSGGRDNGGDLTIGSGISNVTGYQFHPRLGVGLGVGLDFYNREGETLYPVFAEVRSYLPYTPKPNSLYLALSGGYGFATARRSKRILEAEGGWMIYPAVGLRTGARQHVDLTLDAGIKWQKASFTRDLFNGDIEVREYRFVRFVFRLGIMIR